MNALPEQVSEFSDNGTPSRQVVQTANTEISAPQIKPQRIVRVSKRHLGACSVGLRAVFPWAVNRPISRNRRTESRVILLQLTSSREERGSALDALPCKVAAQDEASASVRFSLSHFPQRGATGSGLGGRRCHNDHWALPGLSAQLDHRPRATAQTGSR